jgi:hypothetical protein
MVLLDHFRPPLSARRHWHAFHNAWATYLATDLNQRLPEGYFAEPNVQFGIEIDVATFQESPQESPDAHSSGTTWQPPLPDQEIVLFPTDEIVEIGILSDRDGPTLNCAIELVSPANKDRPQQRDAFISKCETYLREGISLIIVDVVTTRRANLHQALIQRLQGPHLNNPDHGIKAPAEAPVPSALADLYAAAYRPVQSARAESELQIWYETFAIGDRLPLLPLWLRHGICLPLNLQDSYSQTCQSQRLS